jgi:hypothetical protein
MRGCEAPADQQVPNHEHKHVDSLQIWASIKHLPELNGGALVSLRRIVRGQARVSWLPDLAT